jgi:RNA polymerase sigma-70 factor (ECF subfamily)
MTMSDTSLERRVDATPIAAAAEESAVAEVVAGCQAGSRESRRLLYELFHGSMYRLLARMVGEHEAPDLVQDAFLQVYAKVGQFAGQARFTTWLYRLATNVALQHLRKMRRQRHAPLDTDPEDLQATDGQAGEHRELLQTALQRIDPQLRAIFLLRELEGQSYRDIAQALEIPEGTVGSRLNRARRELKEHLAALGWEG